MSKLNVPDALASLVHEGIEYIVNTPFVRIDGRTYSAKEFVQHEVVAIKQLKKELLAGAEAFARNGIFRVASEYKPTVSTSQQSNVVPFTPVPAQHDGEQYEILLPKIKLGNGTIMTAEEVAANPAVLDALITHASKGRDDFSFNSNGIIRRIYTIPVIETDPETETDPEAARPASISASGAMGIRNMEDKDPEDTGKPDNQQ